MVIWYLKEKGAQSIIDHKFNWTAKPTIEVKYVDDSNEEKSMTFSIKINVKKTKRLN